MAVICTEFLTNVKWARRYISLSLSLSLGGMVRGAEIVFQNEKLSDDNMQLNQRLHILIFLVMK